MLSSARPVTSLVSRLKCVPLSSKKIKICTTSIYRAFKRLISLPTICKASRTTTRFLCLWPYSLMMASLQTHSATTTSATQVWSSLSTYSRLSRQLTAHYQLTWTASLHLKLKNWICTTSRSPPFLDPTCTSNQRPLKLWFSIPPVVLNLLSSWQCQSTGVSTLAPYPRQTVPWHKIT